MKNKRGKKNQNNNSNPKHKSEDSLIGKGKKIGGAGKAGKLLASARQPTLKKITI